MSTQTGYVSLGQVIFDALYAVDDVKNERHPFGFYVSLARQALKELAFDSYFPEIRAVSRIPANGILALPDGLFDIRRIYVFSGERCELGNSTMVYWKRNYYRGSGGTFTADDTWENNGSKLQDRRVPGPESGGLGTRPSDVCFYNVQDGKLMLSDKCLGYEKVMIEYSGVEGAISDCPIVPHFAQQAITDWVIWRAAMLDKIRYPELRDVERSAQFSLRSKPDGSWHQARKRISNMDRSEENSLRVYLHGIGHGQ